MRILTLFLLATLLFSCGENDSKKDFRSENGLPPRDTTPIPAAPAVNTTNAVPLDAAWIDFWKTFQQAVANDGRAMMFSLTKFPFPGAHLLSDQVYAEKCDLDNFRLAYFSIFNELTKKAISQKSAMEVESYTLVGDAYKGSIAEEIGISEGSKIYKFKAGKIVKNPAGGTALAFDNFHFGKFGGIYKFAWIDIERP